MSYTKGMTITHQTVLGEDGKPTATLIPCAQFVELVETYGLVFERQFQG